MAFGCRTEACQLRAIVTIHDPRAYRRIAFGGTIGVGEAYMAGDWSADDLTTLIRIFVLNADASWRLEGGLARAAAPLHKLYHALRRNNRRGSRANIAAHYDLGDNFFEVFLDETMMYSCGIFERPDATMHDASVAKNDRICRKLGLSPGDHVLEIGTGWGGFALHAAGRYGCRITTTTISRQQHEATVRRVREAGLADRVEVLLCDYRDLTGSYDKIVSIEMLEAVGSHYYDRYFGQCCRLLRPDGRMLLQFITIADQAYALHRRTVDFIKRYIFPGSCIPSLATVLDSIRRATDLRMTHLEDITPHYARTLRAWRERFFANIDRVRGLGYPESFIRMWEFYLCYCEGGFAERYLGDVQVIFSKPGNRAEPVLGMLHAVSAGRQSE